jgi:hypothetical protein
MTDQGLLQSDHLVAHQFSFFPLMMTMIMRQVSYLPVFLFVVDSPDLESWTLLSVPSVMVVVIIRSFWMMNHPAGHTLRTNVSDSVQLPTSMTT